MVSFLMHISVISTNEFLVYPKSVQKVKGRKSSAEEAVFAPHDREEKSSAGKERDPRAATQKVAVEMQGEFVV